MRFMLAMCILLSASVYFADESYANTDPEISQRYTKAYGTCMNSGAAAKGVQPAMNACASDEYERQDKMLNIYYGQVMATKRSKSKINLRNNQRKWIIARDKVCISKRAVYEGGSMAPLVYFTCMTNETIARIIWLEKQSS